MHDFSTSSAQDALRRAQADVPEDPEPAAPEAGIGEAQKVALSGSPRMKLFAVFVNLLVLAELTAAMYFAALEPDRLTPMFFKIFFSLLIPTIICAFVGRKLIARAERR